MTAAQPSGLTCVLFDLDGTLVDSAPGITDCLAEAILAFGGPRLRATTLRAYVGPPIIETVRTLTGLPDERVPEAIAHYRALYRERGIAGSRVFPGIPELLRMLRERGIPVAVATSKRESQARELLAHHGIEGAFAAIAGAAEDDSGADKRGVIESALARLGLPAAGALMIGDRVYDIRGARAVGATAIFASWGYGVPDEADGAAFVARDPHEAARELRALLPEPAPSSESPASAPPQGVVS